MECWGRERERKIVREKNRIDEEEGKMNVSEWKSHQFKWVGSNVIVKCSINIYTYKILSYVTSTQASMTRFQLILKCVVDRGVIQFTRFSREWEKACGRCQKEENIIKSSSDFNSNSSSNFWRFFLSSLRAESHLSVKRIKILLLVNLYFGR
jgi:hypothetical protein